MTSDIALKPEDMLNSLADATDEHELVSSIFLLTITRAHQSRDTSPGLANSTP
jgi:hypothetical protein